MPFPVAPMTTQEQNEFNRGFNRHFTVRVMPVGQNLIINYTHTGHIVKLTYLYGYHHHTVYVKLFYESGDVYEEGFFHAWQMKHAKFREFLDYVNNYEEEIHEWLLEGF